uniref:Coiled-coil alpha-helical rod protein 1 n=1 Tax=Electrophorus electricus TaxID=8005 RepID=A0A4W4FBL9_ELEEL
MQQLCEKHSAELSAQIHTNTDLQNTLHALTQEVTLLRRQAEEVTSERDTLKEQLRLQKEKESLCLSIELLNVRVKSANDILDIQERELGEQCDPLHKDCRACRLLGLWRQKVFMLLVQLRCRDSQLHTEKCHLHSTVSDLQQEVQKFQSQISVLQHNLQDKIAQLELHNIHTQFGLNTVVLCGVFLCVRARRVGLCVEEWEGQMEAVQGHMRNLTHRLTFATKPQCPSEVALLSSERDKLTLELKRTPELIHNALRDLQQQLDREVGLLTQSLSRSSEELKVCERRRSEAQRQCEEQEGTIAELRAEALNTQRVLQERVSEMERSCDKQLREMEAQLNTARREHTKAVVALRQVERNAEREREQEREAQRLHAEHTHRHTAQLHTQLKEKDKDRNILLAVVQQQGLMNEYKRMRRAAVHTSRAMLEQQQHKQQQQHGSAEQQEGEKQRSHILTHTHTRTH